MPDIITYQTNGLLPDRLLFGHFVAAEAILRNALFQRFVTIEYGWKYQQVNRRKTFSHVNYNGGYSVFIRYFYPDTIILHGGVIAKP